MAVATTTAAAEGGQGVASGLVSVLAPTKGTKERRGSRKFIGHTTLGAELPRGLALQPGRALNPCGNAIFTYTNSRYYVAKNVGAALEGLKWGLFVAGTSCLSGTLGELGVEQVVCLLCCRAKRRRNSDRWCNGYPPAERWRLVYRFRRDMLLDPVLQTSRKRRTVD